MRDELHLSVRGLLAAATATVPLAIAAGVADGPAAVASVGLGAGLVAANLLLAALSTGWSRRLTPGVAAFGYVAWVVRMFAVFAALALLAQVAWIHRGFVAAAFCIALVAGLTAESLSYVRGTYVPRWRMMR